jgi:glutamyl-tRNA reductase
MIGLIGLDHHEAPADVRGRLTFVGERLDAALRALVAAPGIAEVALLSTCNRTEVYVATADWIDAAASVERFLTLAHQSGPEVVVAAVPDIAATVQSVTSAPMLAPGIRTARGSETLGMSEERPLGEYLYTAEGVDAVRHLFEVAAGLRSMVVGESQILGQVKDAIAAAEAAESAGEELRALFTRAIKVGKRARSDTEISRANASLAGAAVRVASESLGGLEGKSALVIGAGRTSQLCARLLRAEGIGNLVLANRSARAADDLASEVGAAVVALEDVCEALERAHLVVSATAAPHMVLSAATVACGLRGRRSPLVIVDLAMPADVDPAAGLLPQVSLYTLDMLREAGEPSPRADDVAQARAIVEAGTREWARSRQVRMAVPGIAALRRHVDRSEQAELARALGQLGQLSEADRQVVERFGERLVDKMFHHLVARIRSLAEFDEVPPDITMRVLTRLFADPDDGAGAG